MDLKGFDHNGPKRELFLDQFTTDKLKRMFTEGAYHTIAIDRLGIPGMSMLDGSAGINSMFSSLSAVSYSIEVMVTSTWNDDLAYVLGQAAVREAITYGVQVWYAPAMNLHCRPQLGVLR